MSVLEPPNSIIGLLRSAADDILIVAPYIKYNTLQQLMSAIPNATSRFTCVTRWLPEDIASGVCDLEIFDLITKRPGGVLRIHPNLHAKYYRASNIAIVGSANITSRALGWSAASNIELLVQLSLDFPGLVNWEKQLLDSTLLATADLRDQIAKEAATLKAAGPIPPIPEVGAVSPEPGISKMWFPQCPVPERLWEVYKGTAADTMIRSAWEGAEKDLIALSPPKGLSKDLFKAYIIGILKQMPIIKDIDKLSSKGLSDSQAEIFLADTFGRDISYSHEEVWRILKRWLTYFFPKEFRLETTQEVLIKGKEIRQ